MFNIEAEPDQQWKLVVLARRLGGFTKRCTELTSPESFQIHIVVKILDERLLWTDCRFVLEVK